LTIRASFFILNVMFQVRVLSSISILFLYLFLAFHISYADFPNSIDLNAHVPGPVATVSGTASPLAQIVATSGAQFLGKTTADSQSNFNFPSLGLFKKATELCLAQTDNKAFGQALACLSFAPATQDMSFDNLFLPPTISLTEARIAPGASTTIRGFSAAGAGVEIRVNGKETFTAVADNQGYYNYNYKNVPAGRYLLSASATLNGKKSLEPKSEVELVVSLGSLVTTREAGKGDLLSPWLVFFIFLIVLIPALGFLGLKTPQGKVLWMKFLNTPLGVKFNIILQRFKSKKKENIKQTPPKA